MNRLTLRQARFVEEYCLDGNGTQAAIRSGYSHRTARQIAYENLTKPYISAAIARKLGEIQSRLDLTRDGIVQRLWQIGDDPLARASARVRALMEVARIMGWLSHPSVVQAQVNHAQNDRLADLSDEELRDIIASGRQARLEAWELIRE